MRTGTALSPATWRTETKRTIKRFQPLRYARDGDLRESIVKFTAWLEEQEQRLAPLKRRRSAESRSGFAHAVETLICNLLTVPADGETALAIHRDNDVMWGKARYRPQAYGQHFRDAVDAMSAFRLVEVVQEGFHCADNDYGQPTAIVPLRTALAVHVPAFADTVIAPIAFRSVDPPETIVLKGVDKNERDYVDTPATVRWRTEMQSINAALRDAAISIAANAVVDEEGYAVDAANRTLRRIFNNGDWEQGGRLAGGFWMNMARDDRYRLIRIAGAPVANVDFRQFNLRLAYGKAGVAMPDDGTDPYVAGEGEREGWKQFTNALFNRKKPHNGWPAEKRDEREQITSLFPPGTKAADVIRAIKSKHAPIAHLFEHRHGLHFMRKEADILIAVLLQLIERGITALPLHDSVLVQAGENAEIAKQIMEAQSNAQTGTVIPANIETHSTATENSS